MAHPAPTAGVTPHIVIRDRCGREAIAFYARAFGAEQIDAATAEDGERLMHAHLIVNGASLMLNDDFPEFTGRPADPPTGCVIHLQVDDPDAWFARATEAGAEVVFPLADQFWGDRYGQLGDPFGHRWSIGAPIKE